MTIVGYFSVGFLLSVLNVFVRIATNPQMDNMMAKPTIPHKRPLPCSARLSGAEAFIMNITACQMMKMTARAIKIPINVLPRLVNLLVNEPASVMTVCAIAADGTKIARTVMIFFIFILINNINLLTHIITHFNK